MDNKDFETTISTGKAFWLKILEIMELCSENGTDTATLSEDFDGINIEVQMTFKIAKKDNQDGKE